MILAIDAGNSRTKWGVFDAGGTLLHQGAVDNDLILTLLDVAPSWQGCRRAVVSNVAGAGVWGQLQTFCQHLALPQLIIEATSSACGVSNGYSKPQQLGSDRWAALVATWNRYREPCVVAMAGTALTVDALSASGEFLGGLIVPGRRLIQSALACGTAGLGEKNGQLQQFPVNTEDGISSGAWLAMAGAVETMKNRLEAREGRGVRCVLSGGDATGLQAALSSPAEIFDNLVLRGLWLIEREYA